MPPHFSKGDKIEVTRGSAAVFYSATVILPPPANQDGFIYVKYSTLSSLTNPNKRLREYVSATRVRPQPSVELHRFYKEGEAIEADHGGAWRVGRVVEVLENSRYLVALAGDKEEERVEVDQWSLRLHRDWDGGAWVPPFPLHQVKSPDSSEEPRQLNLRIKFRVREPRFCLGTTVEVKRDQEGRLGSWLNATIVDSIGDEKFFVEYQSHENTKTKKIHREIVDATYIRPCPPEIARVDCYILSQEVDVLSKGMWLMGYICKVLGDDRYIVRVGSKNDVLIVEHSRVRIHQDWIDGKWVAYTSSQNQEITPKIAKSRRKSMRIILDEEFSKGTLVEVKSNEEGYQGAWYTATIIGPIQNDKYVVEYQTLKTDDESELLKEKVDACHLRPCPPNMQRVDRFRLFERVDVWYNDGWWVGIIIRILEDLDYTVYFWTTNEELICGHFALRPRQEWIDGKFIADFMKSPVQVTHKPKPAKSRRKNNSFPPHEPNLYTMGMKVEVRSDEQGYSGTWYPAIVLGPKGKGNYLVEYKTLKADNEMKLLKEVVDSQYMRPSPPVTQCANLFDLYEEVEVWYNIAWWHGCVCDILKGSKYAVRVEGMDEVAEFEHFEIRRRRNWVGGKWPSTPTL